METLILTPALLTTHAPSASPPSSETPLSDVHMALEVSESSELSESEKLKALPARSKDKTFRARCESPVRTKPPVQYVAL